MAEYVILAFYIVFLVIFFLTAMVALGGILKCGPFKNMDPMHTKLLIGALLIELTGAVLLTYRNLSLPDWQETLSYQLSMTYVDYIDDWKMSLTPFQIDCIELYDNGYSPSTCQDIIESYKKIKSVIGDEGVGELYLEKVTGLTRQGKALYVFPGESIKLVMDVTGHKEIEGFIRLTFKQPKRYIKGNQGELIERPEYKFTIDFYPDTKDPDIYRGTLYHPITKIKGEKLKLADAVLVKKGG